MRAVCIWVAGDDGRFYVLLQQQSGNFEYPNGGYLVLSSHS